ncbi:MAG TPA: DUF1349 domain-containing protein [Bacteroidales bacterium]|nr:DUF1349 domain-containing protein [Bacteroidales bacterium]
MYKNNSRDSSKFSGCSPLQLSCSLTGKCHAIGYYYYTTRGGEFEVSVKISGNYKTRFDQMGLMLRIDEEYWIKTGIEYVDGVYNFSTVVTDVHRNWSVIELNGKPESVWIKAVRKIDAVEFFFIP